jgi:hypothetical protein
MANSLINQSEQARLAFGVANVRKCDRLFLTDAIVAAATTGLQDLLDRIVAAALVNPAQYHHVEALLREIKWLAGKDILTDTVINNLLTVSSGSTVTDLLWNFYSYLDDQPGFDNTQENFTESASGSTSY